MLLKCDNTTNTYIKHNLMGCYCRINTIYCALDFTPVNYIVIPLRHKLGLRA
ncbi:ORF100 peptide [Hyphantria cunea nucleopolyhedrovirus]|uniref:ORF100 peptide n=1 Tax=Hyphantria cunea nuclear polyhedrosis virus TaxID=28288 RepID=Q2NP11_NPVHC|nr:ORF100 peptide [Hyphantria cunea nucleopolyhedrovirus]BAE72389.1 ORF100 peptide [Hyphantria cunea nucleopolyhedrovirus]